MKSRHRKHRTVNSAENKRAVTVILVWIGVAVLAVVLSLLIGNALEKAASGAARNVSDADFLYKYSADDVPPINATPLLLEGKNNESLDSAINTLDKGSQVSLYVKCDDKIPYYDSAVYYSIHGVSGAVDLSSLVGKLHEKDIYVSACFDCTSYSETNTFAKDAQIALEAAMIGELFGAGIDEVVVTGLPTDSNGIRDVSRLFYEVRQRKSDAVLGAGMDYRDLISSNGAFAIKKYSEFADFCAVDTSECETYGDSIKNVSEKLLYSFKTYPLRMLIGITGESNRISQVDILRSLGINNIQAYKYVEVTAAG